MIIYLRYYAVILFFPSNNIIVINNILLINHIIVIMEFIYLYVKCGNSLPKEVLIISCEK